MNYHRDRVYLANESLFRNIFSKRFNLIKGYLSKDFKGRVLDVGCTNGVFLDLFNEIGFETWGVEPSKNAVVAKNKGHKVLRTYFEKANLPKNYFDLVILNHTLEHMNDPLMVLKKVKSLLKSGGIVFVDVPNAGGLGSKIMGKNWPYRLPKEHKWQFTKKSLSKVFKDTKFDILFLDSRSGIFEYANPLLEIKRKRFILDILTFPYSFIATYLNMGDSMSFIAKKK